MIYRNMFIYLLIGRPRVYYFSIKEAQNTGSLRHSEGSLRPSDKLASDNLATYYGLQTDT